MNNKAMLALLIVMTVLPQTEILASAPLPPRAFARIGDHRFYHGPGIGCAVLSSDGRRIASSSSCDPVIVLWDAATGKRLHELRVPRGLVAQISFSPDGKRLAASYQVSGPKSGLLLFDVETGKLLWRLGDFQGERGYLQFSADGKELRVSEERGPVNSWDSATGKRLRLWKPPPEVLPEGGKNGLRGAWGVLSPDGKFIAWEMELFLNSNAFLGTIGRRVYDADTDKLLYQQTFDPSHVVNHEPISFSADSERFATGYGGKFTLWQTATGKELAVLKVPDMVRFALTPDGRRAVIEEEDSRLRLWDIETGKPSRTFCSSFAPLKCSLPETLQVFSGDGKTLLLATLSTLRLFDVGTGEERSVPGHRIPVTPRFSSDGRTLFTSCGEKRCSWDVSSTSKPVLLTDERRKAWEADCLAHSPDYRLFLDCSEGRVQVRETATGRVLCEWEETGDFNLTFGQFSPDATRVLLWGFLGGLGPPDISFWLYDAKTGKTLGEIKTVERASDPVFSPHGRLVAWADRANVIHLHDAATGKIVRTLRSTRPLDQTEFRGVILLFSPDSEYLIECLIEGKTRQPMRMFQVSSGREITRFSVNLEKKHRLRALSCATWSPDSRRLAVAERDSGTIRLLEVASGKVRAEFAGHRDGVHGLAFSPDGQILASGGEDNVVFLWDVTGAKTPAIVEKTLAALWSDLANEDAQRAGDAIAGLLRKPQASAAFLKDRLRPAETPDEKHLARLLAELNSDAFETRAAANRELARLGERAETALQSALHNHPSLEARRRIEDLLNKLERGPLPLETLQTLRAIEVLEHLGTPAARNCLETLAKGAPEARPTCEVKKALHRLANRR